jgi:NAD-dependent SIR2 family protein deacetylase
MKKVECCKCDVITSNVKWVDDKDYKGDPVKRPLCPSCYKEEVAMKKWISTLFQMRTR